MTDRRRNEEKVKPLPSQEELNRILRYVPETGELFWKERPRSDFASDRSHKTWNKRYSHQLAITYVDLNGYKIGHVFGVTVKAHRLIWKMVTGKDPVLIDHENGEKADNRWDNLRSVDGAENMKNKKMPSSNKSGVVGVYWNKSSNKWHAQMKVGDSRIHLGFFHDLEEARKARADAELDHGFHINHGRRN